MMELKPADVIMSRGRGIFSESIRIATREQGEKRSIVNHVGIIESGGTLKSATVIESLASGTQRTSLSRYAKASGDFVTIWRLTSLTDQERGMIVRKAQTYIGKRYGWGMIAASALDWIIGSRWHFRGMIKPQEQIVCSSVVGMSYAEIGYSFLPAHKERADTISPDDIWDKIAGDLTKWLPVGVI
jgi:hypothetical protein